MNLAGFMAKEDDVQQINLLLQQADWCDRCGVVKEGEEHDYAAHGSSKERAEELKAWKQTFKQQQ
jgi:hypothetical protein